MKVFQVVTLAAGLSLSSPALAAALDPAVADSVGGTAVKSKANAMAAKAIAYLRSKQDPGGGWSIPAKGPSYPAITGLVLQGMLMHDGIDAKDPAAAKGISWILSKQQPDGGIYETVLPVYNTAIALTALSRANTPEAQKAIKPAQDFLKALQYSEETRVLSGNSESAKPVKKEDPFYGGWGYGNRGRPDLSNTAFALEALHASGLESSDVAYQRAQLFLQRCQMDHRLNDAPFAAGSTQGGFIYSTSASKDAVGGGQSFAGEVVESLSGPPGTCSVLHFNKDKDGKPPVKKAALAQILKEACAASSIPEVKAHASDFLILTGPNSDGQSSLEFTIRSGIEDPAQLKQILTSSLATFLADPAAVEARSVRAWKGESHLRAYGTMSYAGFKSYLYSGLNRNDPRVQAVMNWASRNYTLSENPGVGTDGYYYYILVFGRAMNANGEELFNIVGENGKPEARDWRGDLVAHLATLQQPDGSFKSIDSRWMEDNDVLITAYALVALESAAK